MHDFIKYLGAAVILGIGGIYVFSRVFAERPVNQSRAATIIVGIILCAFLFFYIWGRMGIFRVWPEM